MFDTLRFRIKTHMPAAFELRAKNFKKPVSAQNGLWIKNIQVNKACVLKLNFYRTYQDEFLSAEVSLPKLIFGNNVQMLSPQDIEMALDAVSDLVTKETGITFDAGEASLTRLDICYNWQSTELDVYARLETLKTAHYPRKIRRPVEDSSVYFSNTGRRNSEEVLAYAKHAETHKLVKKGAATDDHLKKSVGIFRLEHRFYDDAIARLAKRLNLASRNAQSLLSVEVVKQIIKADMEILNLDKAIKCGDRRLSVLLEYCGDDRAKFQRLAGLLFIADTYGGDHIVSLKLVKSTKFYDERKELMDAGVWQSQKLERNLAPLHEPTFDSKSDFDVESADLSNTSNLFQPSGIITDKFQTYDYIN